MLLVDPLELDGVLARYARLSARFRQALRTSDAPEHAFELPPRELRDEQLAELTHALARDPLAKPLTQWTHELLVRHACLDAERRVAHARFRDERPFDGPERGRFTPQALLERSLSDAGRRRAWLEALARHTSSLASARFALWETRAQALESFPEAAPSGERAELVSSAAARLLDSSRDAATSLGLDSFESWVSLGVGVDAIGDYPTRLSARSLVELLGERAWLHGLEPELRGVPALLGSSSVLRGMAQLGEALHNAAARERRPFVANHDPFEQRALLFGALFGMLPSLRPFAERRLAIARARLGDHERSLMRVVLLGARALALRALLAGYEARGERSYREAFAEQTARCFGFELEPVFAGALFVRRRAREELAAFLLALVESSELAERHDEDWFRNPRAIAELRARLESPPELSFDEARLTRGTELLLERLRAAL
ncbi:MAG TPA: hypothetical protein VFQ35_14960 [Polyangiaceae bacterium]|nr:hypothetical protein [Polyangiaceae bacterium]